MSVSSQYNQGKAKTSWEETLIPHDQRKASAKGGKVQQMLYFCKGEEIAKYRANLTHQLGELGQPIVHPSKLPPAPVQSQAHTHLADQPS